MALFKILKGQSANLPNTYHEGYCYFTTDTKKFYIDISSENDPSSRVELNANIADYAARAYYDEDGINIKNNYLKTGTNSSLDANEILITDNQKNVTTRKLVEEYSIVSALPATPDQNVIYLIEDGEYSGSSGGSSSGGSGSNVHYVTLTYSNGVYTIDSSYSQISNWLAAGEIVILKEPTGENAFCYHYFRYMNQEEEQNPFLVFSQIFSGGSTEVIIPSNGAISVEEYSFLTWDQISIYDGSVSDGGGEPT